MSKIIDLAGTTLDGVNLEADATYINGTIRYCKVSKADNVTLGEGITIITGEDHGVEVSGSNGFTADGVTVTCEEGVTPRDSTFGIHLRGGDGHKVLKTKFERARFGVGFLECSNFEMLDCDVTGISEDGVRIVSCQTGIVGESQFYDFGATEEIGGADLHPDGIQMFSRKGVANTNITYRNLLVFQGKGTKFTPIFNRHYDAADRPDPVNFTAENLITFTRGGNAQVFAGTGQVTGSLAAGYEGGTIGKVSVGEWNGSVNESAAQHWYSRDIGYSASFAPEGKGNRRVDAYTEEQVAEVVAAWRAKFRPVTPVEPDLPEGLSPAVLDFLDARFARLSA